MPKRVSPIAAGALLALLAAFFFGVTVPIIQYAGRRAGPFTTAALLYAGACLSALTLGRATRSSGTPLKKEDLGRLAIIALLGAALAPTLLAWGLQRSGATIGSLLLNLEAFFTVLLARAVYLETIGRRVIVALAFIGGGGILLTLDTAAEARWSAIGAVAIAVATLAWALDNTLTRRLAERDPIAVVATKGALGAAMTGTLALAVHDDMPPIASAALLLACGATGYGLSLRLYLLAQRRIGAARTGSIFAIAPFVGATIAWLDGDRKAGSFTAISAMLFGAGIALHLTEKHRHRHAHPAAEHDHVHRHDDGHHEHAHHPPFIGEHAHAHRHDPTEHDHDHAEDVHHGHAHA